MTALLGIIVWSLGWVSNTFSNLLLSLALAGILALVLHPVVVFLERRLHLPHLLATTLVLIVFFAGIGALIFVFVPTAVSQLVELMSILPERLASWQEHFSYYFPELRAMISARMESSGGEDAQQVVLGVTDPAKAIMSSLGLIVGIKFCAAVPVLCLALLGLAADSGVRPVIRIPQTHTVENPVFHRCVRRVCHCFFSGAAHRRREHGCIVCRELHSGRIGIRHYYRTVTRAVEYRPFSRNPDRLTYCPTHGLSAARWRQRFTSSGHTGVCWGTTNRKLFADT